ncbi:hypothetical protein ACLOJK_005495, partial [Asimina triloba]
MTSINTYLKEGEVEANRGLYNEATTQGLCRGPDNVLQLLFIHRFAMGSNRKSLTKESDWVVILTKNYAHLAFEGITIDSKLLGGIWGFEDWGMKHD